MKRTLFLLLASLLGGQVVYGQHVSVYNPQPTPGQPWFALKGFPINHWAEVYVDAAIPTFSWSVPTNIGLITGAPNTFAGSDFMRPQGLTATGNAALNAQTFYVSAATSTTFNLCCTNGSAAGGTESSAPAIIQKLGPGTQTGTWSWTNTGATPANVTLTSQDGLRTNTGTSAAITGEQPFVTIQFNTDGNCSTSGTSGFYVTTSTVKGNLIFTADADPTKTATYPYVACAPGAAAPGGKLARIYAATGYRQAFKDTKVILRARVRGNSNRGVVWTMTGSPVGANGVLSHANFPHAVFDTGTVAGQYEFTATAAVDGTVTDKAVVYVANQTRTIANPDKTEQVPCENDPQAGFTEWTVGVGKTYTTWQSVPMNNLTGPTIVRVFNSGAPGSPTTFHEYTAMALNPAGLTTQPDVHHPLFVHCSVPNASGEYPVFDGLNATGPAWINTFLAGKSLFFSITSSGQNSYFTNVPLAQRYVSITNFHGQNAQYGVPFTGPSGPGTWGDSSAVTFYNCEYCANIGTWTNNVAIPFFTDFNSANNNWGGGSFHVITEGGHLQLAGSVGLSTEHPIYTQGQDDVIASTLIEGVLPGAKGATCWSSRASNLITEYNRCVPGAGAAGGDTLLGETEVQNARRYIIPSGFTGSSYFGAVGDTSCSDPFCNGDQWGPNGLAALIMEHYQTALNYGNTFQIKGGEKSLGCLSTNRDDAYTDVPVNCQYYYNTFAIYLPNYTGIFANSLIEESRITSPGSGLPDPRDNMWPHTVLGNNIIPWTTNTSCSNQTSTKCYGITQQDTDFVDFTGPNLVSVGQMNASSPVLQRFQGTEFRSGMANDIVDIDYQVGLTTALNYRWKGFNSGNFPTYTTYPIDTTTFAPVSGSAAIGIATALTGLQALYPPIFNSVDANGNMTLRTDLTTVGAQDPSGAPTPVSFAVTPNPLSATVSTSGTLTCTTTLSDSSTRSCFSPSCSSSNTGSMTISGLNWTATATTGTGTLTCNTESLTPQTDPFTVSAAAPPGAAISGNVSITGNFSTTP